MGGIVTGKDYATGKATQVSTDAEGRLKLAPESVGGGVEGGGGDASAANQTLQLAQETAIAAAAGAKADAAATSSSASWSIISLLKGIFGLLNTSARATATATIASGASVTSAIDLSSTALTGFIMPAAWTTAALNVEVSHNNADWATSGVFDSSGLSVLSIAAPVAGAAYAVNLPAMLPWRYIRLRSGTFASAVNQGADRVFTVITRPLS